MSASGIRAGRAFVEIGANSLPLQAALARVRARLSSFGASVASIGGSLLAAGAGVAAGIGAIYAWPLKLASELEQSTVKFKVMLGSAEAASQMLDKIRNMAAATPFETSDLLTASELLLNFGVSAEELIPILSALGDASGGNAERFQSMALAFGQISSNGRLTGQDLMQMINAGFNPLEDIANRTGETMEELRKRMEAGGVSITEVKQALADATGPGGRLFGMMNEQAQTLAGRWSTLKDAIANALIPLGQSMLPMVSQGIQAVTAIIGNFGQAWEILVSLAEMRFTQFISSNLQWINKFKDAWTSASSWIAQVGVVAFEGLETAWDSVATSIGSAVDWIWSKLKMLLELLQMAGEGIGLLEQSQANAGKSVGDRLGAIEAERQANAKSREEDFNARAVNRARNTDAMLQAIQQQAEAEKQARAKALSDDQRKAIERAEAAKRKFDELVNANAGAVEKAQMNLKEKAGEVAAASKSSGGFGAFNASLVMQQIQGGKNEQSRIAKATEQTAKGVAELVKKDGSGIVLG